jgi:hypothetical protein
MAKIIMKSWCFKRCFSRRNQKHIVNWQKYHPDISKEADAEAKMAINVAYDTFG